MIYALICAYNEEKTIREVVKDTLKYVNKVIVVNDGSTDNTLEKIKGIKNVDIISYKQNKGKGYALIKGFKHFLNKKGKILITIDADKQHDPSQIPAIKTLVQQNIADIVIGSRYSRKKVSKYPLIRVFFNIGVNLTMILITGSFFADVASGFRCYSRNAIKKIISDLKAYDYGIEPEILVSATKHNLRIATIPVTCHYFSRKRDNFGKLAKSYLKFAWKHKIDILKKIFRLS
ncbi:MAG: glycosyltransferase family 2 protein [Candidatus Aenigmarchaeota archaeon]|nr:glycosyltransferase family 2 protein [Candidatus Aenigmarchaeota archaeon]